MTQLLQDPKGMRICWVINPTGYTKYIPLTHCKLYNTVTSKKSSHQHKISESLKETNKNKFVKVNRALKPIGIEFRWVKFGKNIRLESSELRWENNFSWNSQRENYAQMQMISYPMVILMWKQMSDKNYQIKNYAKAKIFSGK